MAVDVSTNLELKEKILSGVNKLADSVNATLGPGGCNVIITDQFGNIRVTKDGVSVAQAFTALKDPIENTAVQLIKSVAQKAVDRVGDGTTTSTLLTQAIIQEGFKAIDAKNNPIQVKVGIDKAVTAVVGKLKEVSKELVNEAQITQVARISANGDELIANVITQALDYVGEDGAVSIEESKDTEITLEKVEGMVFDKGYKTPYFVTEPTKMEANLHNPYVLIVNGRVSSNKQVVEVLNYVVSQQKPLLIIADDVDGEALSTLLVNKTRGTISVCAVKAPEYGDRRLAMLEDIAIMTGGTVISETKGLYIEKIKGNAWELYLGKCRTVTVTATDTTLVDGDVKMKQVEDGVNEDGTPKYKEVNPVEERLLELKKQWDDAKSAFERENLQSRISKLTGGVAIINVGGVSEVEMRERKDRVDDALHATKAAIMEGVVPGGGMALISCEEALKDVQVDNKDQGVGVEIVRKVLYAPFKKILANAGVEDHYRILAEARAKGEGIGYNVKTGVYENFLEVGVIDPTKVTRTALENASSIAGTVLTTTAAVYEIPEEKPSQTNMYE